MIVPDSLSEASWVPGWIRFRLQEAGLQTRVAAENDAVAGPLDVAQQRLEHCVTGYSRKQIGRCLAEVKSELSRLQLASKRESLAALGRKCFEARARSLHAALKKMQEACDLDISHEKELSDLHEDRDALTKEAAPLLTGAADTEFRRFDRLFRQKLFDFEHCRDLGEIKDRIRAMRKALSNVERIVKKSKRLKENIQSDTAAFDALDRGTLTADPRTDEVYVETAGLLEMLKARSEQGDVDRSIGLLDRVEQNLQMLAQYSDHVRRDAAKEIELWRRIASICPRAATHFASELEAIPSEPSGDSFLEWVSLRRSIRKVVHHLAQETRLANANAINGRAAKYRWLDPDERWLDRDERRLYDFAADSYRQWRNTIS